MQIAYHYLRLRQHFANVLEGEQQEVTLPDLAAIFCCKARERFFAWLSGQFGFLEEEGEQRTLDTLRMSFYRPIPALDPAFVGRRTESHMVKQIFDTVVRYDEKTG